VADRKTLQADELTRDLRRWVVSRSEDPPVVASALGYELAALIARHAESLDAANAVVEAWARTMKDQIALFGVGGWHP